MNHHPFTAGTCGNRAAHGNHQHVYKPSHLHIFPAHPDDANTGPSRNVAGPSPDEATTTPDFLLMTNTSAVPSERSERVSSGNAMVPGQDDAAPMEPDERDWIDADARR